MSAVKANGGEVGKRAKNRIARWEAKAGQKPPTNEAGNEAVNPAQPANQMTQNTEITNTQEQTVNQNNDQSSVVNGDNNTVDQNQDNSVSQQGSDNRSAIEQASSDGNQMAHAAVMPADYSSAGADAEAEKLKNSYIDTIRPGTTSEMDTAIKNTQKQEIGMDNDQSSEITGDNNTVMQMQDNSVRNYGGDNRSFVYQGGNSGVDTPVSAMTMSGILDVDDSPAAQAAFHDLHNTLNTDAQKKNKGAGMRMASMYSNVDAREYDPFELEANLQQSGENSYNKATLAYNDVFGDRDAYRGTLSEYKFGAEPKAVNYGDDEDDDD
jgi:vacuolar-type H+-ATPase subunit H